MRVSPHLLFATSPGHLAWEGYGHSREHVNHPGRAGNVPAKSDNALYSAAFTSNL